MQGSGSHAKDLGLSWKTGIVCALKNINEGEGSGIKHQGSLCLLCLWQLQSLVQSTGSLKPSTFHPLSWEKNKGGRMVGRYRYHLHQGQERAWGLCPGDNEEGWT